jgi:hypothetical protein
VLEKPRRLAYVQELTFWNMGASSLKVSRPMYATVGMLQVSGPALDIFCGTG